MTYALTTSCTKCSGKAQPGTVALQGYILQRFPQCKSMGIYNCRTVAGSSSLSKHSCGRAGDTGIPTLSNGAANTALGYPVVQFLDEYSSEFGIEQQIYDRVIYDLKTPRGRYYGGVHPHNDHDHWAQTLAKATTLTYAIIVSIAGPATGGSTGGSAQGDDDMLGFNIGKSGAAAVEGPQSAALQLMLNDRGAKLTADGKAGDLTRTALAAFQTASQIGAPELSSGIIGPYTYAALYKPGAAGSGGVSAAVVDQKIGAHAALKASTTMHPHEHPEGSTGQPV